MRIAVVPLLALPAPALAESPRAAEIFEEARAYCLTEEAGALSIGENAVTAVDLDGDGAEDDEVVSFENVFCQYAGSMFHGTGGYPLHFVIDGAWSQSWWGFDWETVAFNDETVILLARHGSACDDYGAAPCVQAMVAFEDGFQVVRFPESEEDALAEPGAE